MKRFLSPTALAGVFTTALGITVVVGWVSRSPQLLQLNPVSTAMVFNTAVCFTLAGLALLLCSLQATWTKKITVIIAVLLILLPTAITSQMLFGIEIGIDGRDFHSWMADGNTRPGRMAPNTALAFVLTGLVLLFSQRVKTKTQGAVIQALTFLVLLLGLTGLVGYTLQLELLYPSFKATRMAVPTAVGVCVVAVGLWACWRNAAWYKSRVFFKDDERIAFVSAAVLVVVALTAGVAGFAAQQATLERSLISALSVELENRSAIFSTEIEHVIVNAKAATLRPNLRRLISSLNDKPEDPEKIEELRAITNSIIAGGMSGLVILDRNGRQLVSMGQFSAATDAEKDLGISPKTVLVSGDTIAVKVTVPIQSPDGLMGVLISEQSLPLINELLFSERGLGKTGEFGMCFAGKKDLVCYPQFRNQQIYRPSPISLNGKRTPMGLAVQGKNGVFRGLDYRGNHVIAAHAPLGDYGLGIVIKKNTDEIFQPISDQLQWAIPMLLVLAFAGAVVVRQQVLPLVLRLLESERSAIGSELRIRTVVESVGDGIITLDEAGTIEAINGTACQMFGYTEADIIGKNIIRLMPENMRGLHNLGMKTYLAGGAPKVIGKRHVKLPGQRKNGDIFPLELTVNELLIEGRRQFVGIVRDITERELAERNLFREKERLRVTLASIGDAVITIDLDGNVTYLNKVAETMTGWKNEECIGKPLLSIFNIVHEHTNEPAFNPVEAVLRDKAVSGLADNTFLIQRGGDQLAIEDSAAPINDIDGEMIGVVLVFHDVTQARLLANKMSHQATHDALTGLINRREFERRTDLAIQAGNANGTLHTMLFLDLDQFKIVNDTCGHEAGDELLRQLTTVLQEKLRRSDTFARLGGDEFAVLLENCGAEPGTRVAEILRQQVNEFRFVWLDKTFPVGVSIGLATFSNGGISVADVLRMADAACYVAKENGRNRIQVYTPENSEVASRSGEMGWIARIQMALEQNRFVLYSQKILRLNDDSGESHYEVLLRLREEDGSIVPPMAFIPAAERYGLMGAIDRWVIHAAFADRAKRQSSNVAAEICAINLSGTSICDENFGAYVKSELLQFQIDPTHICFEITETAAIINLSKAAGLIRELKALGFRFALDDFGSGMSSFAYLKHLPVDYLKIDGCFVKDMIENAIDCAMVESIHNIGHVMGIKTIAEFVENEQILERLKNIGVDFAQGYGVEKPRPLA